MRDVPVTRACDIALHAVCSGEAVAAGVVGSSVHVYLVDCECLCHMLEAEVVDAAERMLEQ